MRQLSTPLHIARHVLLSDAAWLLFVEAPLKSGGFIRLVRNSRHLAAGGRKWQACSIEIELPESSAEGALGELRITLPNVSRLPMLYLEAANELLGQTFTCWLAHERSLEAFSSALAFAHTALRATMNERVATIVCGHPAQNKRTPAAVYDRRVYPQLLPGGGLTSGGTGGGG